MEIMITDNSFIKDIQEEFQREFPYLKIEFLKNTGANDIPAPKSRLVSGKMLIRHVRDIQREGTINITGNRSVKELETDLCNDFGLWAQIFRKSSSLWIETTLTEHWSLTRQNQEGRQMSL